MKTFVVAAAIHKATGELVHYNDLTVFYDIVNIPVHNAVSTDCLVEMVRKRHIIGIGKVCNIKIFFSLFDTRRVKCGGFRFFINDIVAFDILVELLIVKLTYLGH